MNSSTRTDPARLALRTPEDVLAKVPFLVGFHPKESLVALALGPDRNVLFTLRADLPPLDDGPSARAVGGATDGRGHALASELVHLLLRRGGELALLVAYTARPERAGPLVAVVRTACEDAGIDVLDALVADGRRWWSDACTDLRCCPPDGTPYDLTGHPITAHSVFAGEVALADEDAVHRSLAPVDEHDRPRLRSMAERAKAEVERRFAAADDATPVDQNAVYVEAAHDYLIPLIRSFAAGACELTDEQAARAAVMVAELPVRDEVWAGMSRASARGDVAFWTEVLRRTLAPYDVAPATLLAFAAWLDGGGALARCAVERAFASDPYYSMAHLVAELLAGAVPPEAWSAVNAAA